MIVLIAELVLITIIFGMVIYAILSVLQEILRLANLISNLYRKYCIIAFFVLLLTLVVNIVIYIYMFIDFINEYLYNTKLYLSI